MNKLKAHLQYFWWKYLLVLVGIVFLWTSVFSTLAKPDDNEQVVVSHFGTDYDYAAMNNEILEKLPSITPQTLKTASFTTVASANDSMLSQLIQTRIYTSDIMILSEEMVSDDLLKFNFKQIPQNIIAEYFTDNLSDFEFYNVDGKPFGIILNPLSGKNNFSKYYTGTKKCIAVFSCESVNLAAMYGEGNPTDNAALCVMRYLLEAA